MIWHIIIIQSVVPTFLIIMNHDHHVSLPIKDLSYLIQSWEYVPIITLHHPPFWQFIVPFSSSSCGNLPFLPKSWRSTVNSSMKTCHLLSVHEIRERFANFGLHRGFGFLWDTHHDKYQTWLDVCMHIFRDFLFNWMRKLALGWRFERGAKMAHLSLRETVFESQCCVGFPVQDH